MPRFLILVPIYASWGQSRIAVLAQRKYQATSHDALDLYVAESYYHLLELTLRATFFPGTWCTVPLVLGFKVWGPFIVIELHRFRETTSWNSRASMSGVKTI